MMSTFCVTTGNTGSSRTRRTIGRPCRGTSAFVCLRVRTLLRFGRQGGLHLLHLLQGVVDGPVDRFESPVRVADRAAQGLDAARGHVIGQSLLNVAEICQEGLKLLPCILKRSG